MLAAWRLSVCLSLSLSFSLSLCVTDSLVVVVVWQLYVRTCEEVALIAVSRWWHTTLHTHTHTQTNSDQTCLVHLLHRGMGAQCCDERVCLSVSQLAGLKNNMSKLNELFCTCWPTCGRGSVLLWRQYVTLCTSGFVDDVMFSHNGRGKGDTDFYKYGSALCSCLSV